MSDRELTRQLLNIDITLTDYQIEAINQIITRRVNEKLNQIYENSKYAEDRTAKEVQDRLEQLKEQS